MPNTREKLIELLINSPSLDALYGDYESFAENADYLVANGVTVQDGKPLESFLRPIDAYNGLKAKYLVFKADTGEKVENCFVLCPAKDLAAVDALRAYANTTDNEPLAEDIYNWVGKGMTVQNLDGCEWCKGSESIYYHSSAIHDSMDEDVYVSGNRIVVDIGCHTYGTAEIMFCPMCGRKLPEPPKEDKP